MIYNHKGSVSLRSKIEALKFFPPDEFEGNDSLDERMPRTSERVLTNAVQVRLWRMTVSTILRRPRTTAIKPLDWTDQCFVRSQEAQIMLEEESSLSSGNLASFRSEEVDDAILFGNEGEEDCPLQNQILFRDDGLDSENDELDEDLLSGDCMTMEALDMEEDWAWEGDYVFKGAGDRIPYSDSDGEILFEEDEDTLLDGVVPHREHDSSTRPMHQAEYDEMLMSD